MESGRPLPARAEDALLGSHETDLHLARTEPAKEDRVLLRIGNDDLGGTERGAVEGLQRPRGERAGGETRAILDERFGERDERVEYDRPPACNSSRRGKIEVSRVSDEDRVELLAPVYEQSQLGPREPQPGADTRGELVLSSLPDRHVPLDDLDAGPAQTRDHLSIAGIAALVRAEVEDAQSVGYERTSSTCTSRCSRAIARSSWWLVIISLISPSEKNCIPTTTSKTPSVSNGRCPIAWPVSLTTVR